MSHHVLSASLLTLTFLLGCAHGDNSTDDNLQAWSHRVYNDDDFNLTCLHGIQFPNPRVIGWTKRDSDLGSLVDSDHYQLLPSESGVIGAILRVINVTDEMAGFYVCQVVDQDSLNTTLVLQGLNIAPYKQYRDKLDRYLPDIFRGLIASAGVAFVVLGVGCLSAFRYLTEEQKAKRRFRKRLRKQGISTDENIPNQTRETIDTSDVIFYNGSYKPDI